MCDFLSCVIRRDGKIFHLPTNSHSGIAEHYGLTENDTMADMRCKPRFYEFEWDGGWSEYDLRGEAPPKAVRKSAAMLRENLRRALSEPGWGCLDGGFFSAPEWADVRWVAICNPKCPSHLASRIAKTPLHANARHRLLNIHPEVEAVSGFLWFVGSAAITAPNLRSAETITVEAGVHFSADKLEKAKTIKTRYESKIVAPSLTEVQQLRVGKDASCALPNLVEGGSIIVGDGGELNLPALKTATSVEACPGSRLTAKNLTRIRKDLIVRCRSTVRLTGLTRVAGDVIIDYTEALDLSALVSVGGELSIETDADCQMPALTKVGKSIFMLNNSTLEARALAEAKRDIYILSGASLTARKLRSVREILQYAGASLNVPKACRALVKHRS